MLILPARCRGFSEAKAFGRHQIDGEEGRAIAEITLDDLIAGRWILVKRPEACNDDARLV